MINIQDILKRGYNAQTTSWPTYDGKQLDRSQFVTSSEILNCARRIKFEKAAIAAYGPLPFPNWGYAERGNIIEAWIVEMFKLAGTELLFGGKDQRSFYVDKQSGTPDGMVRYKSGYWVLELKSIDPRTNTRFLPKENHVAQLQQNMDLVATCLDTSVYGGSLFYIDASNLQKSLQFDIDVDHAYAGQLQERAERIMEAPSPADLPSEGMHNGDCDRCTFTAECSQIVAGDLTQLQKAGQDVFK
jgi:hypothetical protein